MIRSRGRRSSRPSRTGLYWTGRYWATRDSGMGAADRLEMSLASGGLGLGVWPVVADAVAEAERAGEPALSLVAAVVGLPVCGLPQHEGFHDAPQARQLHARPPRQPFPLDRLEGEHGLAEGEGEPRPDLQDAEVVFDQLSQAGRGLVVRGVGLVDAARASLDDGFEGSGPAPVVLEHVAVAELDAGLDHDPHHSFERGTQTTPLEGGARELDRALGLLRARHPDAVCPSPARRPGVARRCR